MASPQRNLSIHRRSMITVVGIALLSLLTASSVAAGDAYRFFYNFAPDTNFFEIEQSLQESGGRLISQFRRSVEFRVTRTPGSSTLTLTARIVSLSNKGRRIDYYDGVTFQANISAVGEVSDYSFSGGLPRYSELIRVAGPANRSNIFWMPRFPDTPMKIGDSFSQSASIGSPGVGAEGRTVYELEEVQGHLARFKLRQEGSVESVAIGGTQTSEGSAVFDLEKGMWSSLQLNGEGTAHMPGGLSSSYKTSKHKEVTSYGGCDQATTGVSNPDSVINHARGLARTLSETALGAWPGSGEDLYAIYRHFHCPDSSQVARIGRHLMDARRTLDELTIICIPASADVCSSGQGVMNLPVPSPGGGSSGSHLVELCPSFFGMADDLQAGTLIAAAAARSGVNGQRCMIPEACYYDFLQPAEQVINGNPFAYGYLALERSGWTLRQPDRTPCAPIATGLNIMVEGGEAATDPASVQPYRGYPYEIYRDAATRDRYIYHNNLRGARHYLYGETRSRYYLPGD